MGLKIPSNILKILDILNNCGYEGYLVGGCVRDAAMGKIPHDFDITTNALPDEIIKCFDGFRIIETGLKHGTVTVVSESDNVEITTYRIDGVYLDNRRPENVTFTSLIDEDLSRRDFTVNAMAYNPHNGFVDLFDGRGDLNNGIIRCVGNPQKRFNEDGLRIMRALRFATVLNFDIHPDTSDAIHECKFLLKNISAERIYAELKKLICGNKAKDILVEYYDVICEIFEDFRKYKKEYMENCKKISGLDDDFILRLACILYGMDRNLVVKFMKRLKADNESTRNVVTLSDYSHQHIESDEITVRYLMNKLDDDNLKRVAELSVLFDPDFEYERFINEYNNQLKKKSCVSLKQLAVSGNDIISFGVNKGPDVGKMMNKVLYAIIENKCENTRESIELFVKKYMQRV